MKLLKSGIRINDTAKELIIGDIVYYIIGQIIILILTHRRLYCTVGFILGTMISIFMIIHMAIAMEQAMSMKEKGADFHIRKTTAIRLVAVFLMLVIVGLTDAGNILAAVAGLMALKVSAYLQPFTHKVLVKKYTEKGR